jgi:hypothetical protein
MNEADVAGLVEAGVLSASGTLRSTSYSVKQQQILRCALNDRKNPHDKTVMISRVA